MRRRIPLTGRRMAAVQAILVVMLLALLGALVYAFAVPDRIAELVFRSQVHVGDSLEQVLQAARRVGRPNPQEFADGSLDVPFLTARVGCSRRVDRIIVRFRGGRVASLATVTDVTSC